VAGIVLSVRDLRTHFFTASGVVRAVDGISYDLHEGETMALVGESGSGKSVSAFSLLGLVSEPGRVVGGSAMFEDKDLLKLPPAQLRRIRGSQISMIFQEPMTSLNPVMSIGRQIAEAIEAHSSLSGGASRRRVLELLQEVGIKDAEERYSSYPHQFSGGMRQRAMIAMALCCSPRVLIADEPTTALDVTIQAQVLDLMEALTRKMGTAIILITHNLGLVARYADTVNVMQSGKIVESGSGDAIFGSPSHAYTRQLLSCVPRLIGTKA
jgi:ABC-type dipeptide/oligopeptide/nickel transport system ATPase component